MATRKSKVTTISLSVALRNLAEEAEKMDSVAGQLLDALKAKRVNDLDKFQAVMKEAYEENGWKLGAGRPREGDTTVPAPKTVRLYTSELRVAYRHGIAVTRCRSMTSVRAAVQKAREAAKKKDARKRKPEVSEELQGIRISAPGRLIGALFHDLVAVYEALPPAKQKEMEAAVERLKARFEKPAIPRLKVVGGAPLSLH